MCNQCYFGQAEISIKKEEHIIDVLKQAEAYTLNQRNKIEEDVIETASWQADFQEVETVARHKAAECAQIASETAALRASILAASANTAGASSGSVSSSSEATSMSSLPVSVSSYVDTTPPSLLPPVPPAGPSLSSPVPSRPLVASSSSPHTSTTICNHELHVLNDLTVIEKSAINDANRFLREAEGAVRMQRKLAGKVHELETQVGGGWREWEER